MRTWLITAAILIATAGLLGFYAELALSSKLSRAEERQEREAQRPEREEAAEVLHDDGKRYSGLLEDDVYD